MNKDEMDRLLLDAVVDYGGRIGEGATVSSKEKLKKQTVYQSISLADEDGFTRVRDAAIECGNVLREDKKSGVIEAEIGAGAANMNPAIVVAQVSGNEIDIAAYAREGLIKQHAAKKAVEKLTQALT